MSGDEKQEPVIVCRSNEEIKLSDEELAVLVLGPKFCVYNNLSEATFMREIEEMIVKLRWEMKTSWG